MSNKQSNKAEVKTEPQPEALIGSNKLASILVIGGKEIQLGTIVAGAHAESGFTVKEWNELAEEDRELLLAEYVAELQTASESADSEDEKTPLSTEQESRLTDLEQSADAEAEASRQALANQPAPKRYVAVHGGPMHHPLNGCVFTNEAIEAPLDQWLENQIEAKKIQEVPAQEAE